MKSESLYETYKEEAAAATGPSIDEMIAAIYNILVPRETEIIEDKKDIDVTDDGRDIDIKEKKDIEEDEE